MKIFNFLRRKKYEVPCICFSKDVERAEECLAHTLIHENGGYNNKCKYCNYDDVKYQYEVKLKK